MVIKKTKKKSSKVFKKKTKINKYFSQKGGEEHLSDLDPAIKKRSDEKKRKELLLKTIMKLIFTKKKSNHQKILNTKLLLSK